MPNGNGQGKARNGQLSGFLVVSHTNGSGSAAVSLTGAISRPAKRWVSGLPVNLSDSDGGSAPTQDVSLQVEYWLGHFMPVLSYVGCI